MSGKQVKGEIDRLVAFRTGRSERIISEITAAFVDVLVDQLANNHEVVIENLGRIRVKRILINRKILLNKLSKKGSKHVTREIDVEQNLRVYFSKSHTLKKRLEEAHGKARRRRGC
jgi:nucleoid DNA-binding protein